MPELPEVEVIARGLDASLTGRLVVGAPHADLTRLSEPAPSLLPRILGNAVCGVGRRAKLLLMEMADGLTLAFHLKMTGRLVHGPWRAPHKHDRLHLSLDNGSILTFSDMRRFGYVRSFAPGELGQWQVMRRLGPEPLATDPAALAGRVLGRAGRIKALLLDQTVVAGLGNIYADEALFRAGIHPRSRGRDLTPAQATDLFREVQAVLHEAIAANGSSIRDYVNADGNAGAFQNAFRVYGRKGGHCPTCRTTLCAVAVAGRTSTFCPACQPRAAPGADRNSL